MDRLRGFVFVLIHSHAGVLSNLRQPTGNGFAVSCVLCSGCLVKAIPGKSDSALVNLSCFSDVCLSLYYEM